MTSVQPVKGASGRDGGEVMPFPQSDQHAGSSAQVPHAAEFDWARDSIDIVFETCRAVAIYRNPAGDLVIRQRADWNEEADPTIIIPRDRAELFLLAVRNEVDP